MPNSLVRNPVTLWATVPQVQPTELAALDAEQAGGIDGDNGGVYMPTNPLVIGGAGLQTAVPLQITRGATFIADAIANTILLGDGDFPTLGPTHTGRSRSIVHSPALAKGQPSWLWRVRKEDAGLQAYAATYTSLGLGQTSPLPARAFIPIRAYNGVTIASIVVSFRVTPHANAPSTMPRVRVVRLDAFGNVTPMTSAAAGADVNGFVSVPPASSGAAWYANGATQTLTVTCDQHNVIDISQYDYHVEIVEESGLTGFGNVIDISSAPSTRNLRQSALSLPTFWTGPIWQASHSFATNSFVFPTAASFDSSLYFQNFGPTGSTGTVEPIWPTAVGGTVVDNGVTWACIGSTQKFGTIWQAITVNYTNITDTHWQ